MFSYQWFENNFYLANQPKRKKKGKKSSAADVSGSGRARGAETWEEQRPACSLGPSGVAEGMKISCTNEDAFTCGICLAGALLNISL